MGAYPLPGGLDALADQPKQAQFVSDIDALTVFDKTSGLTQHVNYPLASTISGGSKHIRRGKYCW